MVTKISGIISWFSTNLKSYCCTSMDIYSTVNENIRFSLFGFRIFEFSMMAEDIRTLASNKEKFLPKQARLPILKGKNALDD